MKLPIYQIDTFTSDVFKGNPAAVCPLKYWLSSEVMQSIAEENNLSETAFFVPFNNDFQIRWFTPTTEVDLCGHATLASAHVIWHQLGYEGDKISFYSKSGLLGVTKGEGLLTLDFPAQEAVDCSLPLALEQAFNIKPQQCLYAEDYMLVFKNEAEIHALEPNQELLKRLNLRGVIVTAHSSSGKDDFVTRFFAPKCGVNEDPVTGSAYTQLAPYWSTILGKAKLRARQLSARGGELSCEVLGGRVLISGQTYEYLWGEINI